MGREGCRSYSSPRFDRVTPETLDRLAVQRTIDLTTVGRRSGRPRTVEIWWFAVEGRFVITGTPGVRDWYANVLADPSIVIHALGMELPALAQPITDRATRRMLFEHPDLRWYSSQAPLEELVATSPMVEVRFLG